MPSDAAVLQRPRQAAVSSAASKLAILLLMGALETVLVLWIEPIRAYEASIARPAVALVTGMHGTSTASNVVFFGLGTDQAMGLRITYECSVAVLLIPFVAVSAAIAFLARVRPLVWLRALAYGVLILTLTNVLRLCLIAWAMYTWGKAAYSWSHVFAGSLLAIIGFSVAMIVAVRIIAAHRPD